MKKNNRLLNLKNLIENSSRFLLTTHINPEPDALGSELAFARLLKMFGKQVKIINNDKVPQRFKFMPGVNEVSVTGTSKIDFDVSVVLDCSDLGRIGKVRDFLHENKPIVNIDHHISNTRFGRLNLIDTQASSACEIIYEIFKNFELKIDKQTAMNLYCGILTDTGSFRYSNAGSKSFKIASELVSLGLDVNEIYRKVYRIDDVESAKIIGRLLQCAKTAFDGKVVYLAIPEDIYIEETLLKDLGEQALNTLRLIYGAKVFLLLRKSINNNYVRINLRSNCNVDVNKIASYFDGGGHARAASAKIEGNLSYAKKTILKEIGKRL
ncbi:MAG: bifunctional oligoribonuclease/PAP phosphatase NrnA [Candidatus Omnitrophica bacterium]|nr:bifunctional oligoribonuclease/PAP phosphatase NrnA [Candidatus Omnitrophota bacterium]